MGRHHRHTLRVLPGAVLTGPISPEQAEDWAMDIARQIIAEMRQARLRFSHTLEATRWRRTAEQRECQADYDEEARDGWVVDDRRG
jgi:hypothetical protein